MYVSRIILFATYILFVAACTMWRNAVHGKVCFSAGELFWLSLNPGNGGCSLVAHSLFATLPGILSAAFQGISLWLEFLSYWR
jgi:hypothetical protein